MAGEHGTLLEYIKVYGKYGGVPPIPDDADTERGDRRPIRVWLPVTLFSLAMGLFVISALSRALVEPSGLATGALVVCWMGVSMMFNTMLGAPLMDWQEDVPREGLPRVQVGGESEYKFPTEEVSD